jgi:hypothetical protein
MTRVTPAMVYDTAVQLLTGGAAVPPATVATAV